MKNYLSAIGLNLDTKNNLNNFVKEALSEDTKIFSKDKIESIYRYPVPELGEGGGCGLRAKEPYRLDKTLGLQNADLLDHPNTQRLYRLNQIVKNLQEITGVDWLGIYRKTENLSGEGILLKEAYYGRFSRAEFPLNSEFAKGSNNSTVGLTGKAIVVQDTRSYKGPYYTCDISVKSEFCLPILDGNNHVIGIIDAESFQSSFFTEERLLEICKVAKDLGESNLLS